MRRTPHRGSNLRLRLDRNVAVERNGVKGLGEAVLHVVVEVDTAGRVVGALVVAAVASSVAGVGH